VQDIAGDIPVFGMIEPAARAAIAASNRRNILVMGTQSTIRSACYEHAIHALDPSVAVRGVACQMLVALAEEGADPDWLSGDIAGAIITRYLAPYFSDPDMAPDTIILGCTHFPLLKDAIAAVVGPQVTLIENGGTIAALIKPLIGAGSGTAPAIAFMVTDTPERFAPLARGFLGRAIAPGAITHIDLNDYAAYSAAHHNEKEETRCSI
jgi:glutamate racemase